MKVKKNYVMPQMKAFKVQPATIMAGSGEAKASQNEEYTTGSTDDWF